MLLSLEKEGLCFESSVCQCVCPTLCYTPLTFGIKFSMRSFKKNTAWFGFLVKSKQLFVGVWVQKRQQRQFAQIFGMQFWKIIPCESQCILCGQNLCRYGILNMGPVDKLHTLPVHNSEREHHHRKQECFSYMHSPRFSTLHIVCDDVTVGGDFNTPYNVRSRVFMYNAKYQHHTSQKAIHVSIQSTTFPSQIPFGSHVSYKYVRCESEGAIFL